MEERRLELFERARQQYLLDLKELREKYYAIFLAILIGKVEHK